MMELQYTPPIRTTYAGNVQGSAMVGISSTFEGFEGMLVRHKRGRSDIHCRAEKSHARLSGQETLILHSPWRVPGQPANM